jgi:hypothetical protein
MTQPFQVLRLAELHNACVQVWGVHVKAVQVEWALLHPDWTVMDVMPLCLTQFPLLRQLVWFVYDEFEQVPAPVQLACVV